MILSGNYFLISENLKNRTGLDFHSGQWMKATKSLCSRAKHSHVTTLDTEQSHMFMQASYGQLCISLGKTARSIEIAMAQTCISNSTENHSKIPNSVKQKMRQNEWF